MLTADLVRVRRQGDRLSLIPLAPDERARALELADSYIGLARDHVGRERDDLHEAWRQIPVSARERRLADGLLKLLADGCQFEQNETLDPPALRAEIFARATALRRELAPMTQFDRGTVVADVAGARGIAPADVEAALYADLPGAHLLRSVDVAGPRALVATYEAAGVQAVLLRAVSVRARVSDAPPAAYRLLFRKLKFLRLLHQITPLPPRAGRRASPGYDIQIDGPFSLFESVTKYGLQLALAFPAIAACGRYALEADIRWGKERRPLRFVDAGDVTTDASTAGEEIPLPDEVARLLADLRALPTRWRASPAATIFDLPGLGVCVPDLELRHSESGRSAFVEVMGYWSRDAVWKRIELATAGLPAPFVFAVSKHLRVSEAALPEEVPAALYVYPKALSARALLARVETVAARNAAPPSDDRG